MRTFGRVVLWIFAVVGICSLAFTTLAVVGVIELASHFRASDLAGRAQPLQVADRTVLTLSLEHPISEAAPTQFGYLFGNGTTDFTQMIGAIEQAAEDPRVKGLVVRTGTIGLGVAEAQELRAVIGKFRAKGKIAYAYADSFGEIAGGTGSYYVASAFDEVWLQPTGSLALTGVASEIPFFKGALDKLGIVPEFERRGEFKTAATEFTESKLLDSDRTSMDALVHSIYDQIVDGIAAGRKLSASDVKSLIDGAPYSGDEALAKRLIDHIGYLDEVEAAATSKTGGATVLALQDYLALAPRPSLVDHGGSSIALIRAVGAITGGSNDDDAFDQGTNVAADTLARAFDEAARDANVKAILFRIDSPGGSEVASETIWRAVKRARQAGKPVIVSMANVAASGGYYIAAGADKIVADPTTITGSIGVFGGKFITAGLWDKLGVTWDSVAVGKNAEMDGSLASFTPDQRQRFAGLIDLAYKQFLTRVADGRHMDITAVDAIARGRVWTGAQAKERGLVDELGGFEEAVRLAKQAAHLPEDQKVMLKPLPSRRSPIETLFRGLQGGEGPGRALEALDRLEALTPLLRRLDEVNRPAEYDATMRPMEIRD